MQGHPAEAHAQIVLEKALDKIQNSKQNPGPRGPQVRQTIFKARDGTITDVDDQQRV